MSSKTWLIDMYRKTNDTTFLGELLTNHQSIPSSLISNNVLTALGNVDAIEDGFIDVGVLLKSPEYKLLTGFKEKCKPSLKLSNSGIPNIINKGK